MTIEEKKEARKAYNKRYYEKNKEKAKLYREENSEAISEYRKNYYQENKLTEYEMTKKWRKLNKKQHTDTYNAYIKSRREYDPLFRLRYNIRSLINISIRRNGYSKTSRTHDILGQSYEDFKLHIEAQWEDWMSWDNYGKYNGELNHGWDIDHIVPSSSALTEDELVKLNHFSNLQPLCSKINRDIKKNHY